MKLFFAAVIALMFTYTAAPAQTWESFNKGMDKAKASKKPILVDVYTDWCSWCKKMDANTYSNAKVKDYLAKNFTIIKLNAEGKTPITYKGQTMSPAEFTQGMGITGFPATLFLKSNGDGITVVPGYHETDEFSIILSYIAENRYAIQQFDDYLKEMTAKK